MNAWQRGLQASLGQPHPVEDRPPKREEPQIIKVYRESNVWAVTWFVLGLFVGLVLETVL